LTVLEAQFFDLNRLFWHTLTVGAVSCDSGTKAAPVVGTTAGELAGAVGLTAGVEDGGGEAGALVDVGLSAGGATLVDDGEAAFVELAFTLVEAGGALPPPLPPLAILATLGPGMTYWNPGS
jgi:hypothetical protein